MQQKYFLVIITSNFTVTLLLLELPLYKNSFCPYKQYLLEVKQYFVCLVDILLLIVFESKLVKISHLSNKLFVMFKSAFRNFDVLNVVAHKINPSILTVCSSLWQLFLTKLIFSPYGCPSETMKDAFYLI